jgi:hypothetical protein
MIGPWYISARAVREYCAIATGHPPADDDAFDEAAKALSEAVKKARFVCVQDSGLQLWRLQGSPRLRLLVSTRPRTEGDLPQLVQVLPEHGR